MNLTWFSTSLKAAAFAAVVLLGACGHLSRWNDVFIDGKVYFLDPDCYSRMTRVAGILDGGGLSIRFHAFENAPDGITPHTTAPLDWIIALPAWLTGHRDLCGALVSPVLGFVFLMGVASWGWNKPFGLAATLLAAASPILSHTFSVGRPDHQSLLILLMAAALAAELRIWQKDKSASVFSAVAWALALWVSLFEPLVLLVACLLLRVFVLRSQSLPSKNQLLAPALFVIIALTAILCDGWRVQSPSSAFNETFSRWASTIGELKPATWALIFGWVGWLTPWSPALLVWKAKRESQRAPLAYGILLCFLLILTLSASRWGPFLSLGVVLALPGVLGVLPNRFATGVIFAVSLWPVAAAWDHQLFDGNTTARREVRAEGPLLRNASASVSNGSVLAPWWLSPAIAYWSGQTCVAGSSHQSLPGTADTARFYLSTDPASAKEILTRRKVAFVISDDPARLRETSAVILGIPPERDCMADLLARGTPPDFLEPVAGNRFFRVFRVVDAER